MPLMPRGIYFEEYYHIPMLKLIFIRDMSMERFV